MLNHLSYILDCVFTHICAFGLDIKIQLTMQKISIAGLW